MRIVSTVRQALRTLLAGRLFTVVALICLALGIATNTTMFSVFDAMFLRPLPFPDPERLVAITGQHPETNRRVTLSLDDVTELTRGLRSIQTVAAYTGRTATLNDGGDPERIGVQQVTASLFPLLGLRPQRGLGIEPDNDRIGAGGVALISDSLWRRRYQADPAILGRSIRLDDATYTIVGVMPPKFRFPSTSEIWIPLLPALGASGAATRGVSIIGRLADDVTVDVVNQELGARTLTAQGSRTQRTGTARLYGSATNSEEHIITAALMGATTVLLVMACVNVANLLLARGARRRREIALRTALGASRARIIRQLVTESVMLSLAAGVIALPLSWYGMHWVHDAVPPNEPLGPYWVDWALDVRTLAYSFGVALLTGVAFGIAPAFSAVGRHLLNPLREGAGAAGSRAQQRAHGVLVVAQIALAVVLLAGASIFVRTYAGIRGTKLGYDASHLMTARVFLAGHAYDAEPARTRVVEELARRLKTLPGAHAATVTDLVPLDDQGGTDAAAAVEGRVFDEGKEPEIHYAGVAGRWPETFDVRVEGRTFFEHELEERAPVALVNQTLVRAFWPGANPVGRRFKLAEDENAPWLTVIGVVPDIRTVKLDESMPTPPTAYLPHRFISPRDYGIVIRTQAAPESVVPNLRAAVRAIDPSLALYDVFSMEQVRWLSYWMYVMWGTMFAVFAIIAIFISAVGVFGVVHYTVAQRTKEIGLRVALGASRGQVVGPMLKRVALLTALGIGIGIGGALLLTPLVGSLLLGVSPTDPASFATVSVLLALVAVIATWLPSWRASAVNPVVALREE
jgi:predicted permease